MFQFCFVVCGFDRAETNDLGELVGHDGSAAALWSELTGLLTPDASGVPDPALDALAAAAHPVVLAIVRDKLAVAKPGYDGESNDDDSVGSATP